MAELVKAEWVDVCKPPGEHSAEGGIYA